MRWDFLVQYSCHMTQNTAALLLCVSKFSSINYHYCSIVLVNTAEMMSGCVIIKQVALDGMWNSWWKPWQHVALKQLHCICSFPCSRTFQHGTASVDSQMKAAVAELEAWHIPSSGPCGLPVICLHLTRDLLIALLRACLALALFPSRPRPVFFLLYYRPPAFWRDFTPPTNGFNYSPLQPKSDIASFSCKHHILPKRWLKKIFLHYIQYAF